MDRKRVKWHLVETKPSRVTFGDTKPSRVDGRASKCSNSGSSRTSSPEREHRRTRWQEGMGCKKKWYCTCEPSVRSFVNPVLYTGSLL